MPRPHVLFLGGRSGVGKSTVAFALHDLLSSRDVTHAVIEGDNLDLAYPAPWKRRMAERNLAAVWANYTADGYHRLIYTNTVSVLEADKLSAAVGGDPQVTSVLLQATDGTTAERLARRESGPSLDEHLERSARAAEFLVAKAPEATLRIATDGRTPDDIAEQLAAILDW
ncbi:adenylyl-sulfate kinase [Corynebacterium sp. USCH3]|uniref:adenylyl-sulfate kinase n=1 Tax=Corynebacterium sp. USCH3 TaxID=3024840 RepID=UPI0030A83531